MNRTIAATDRKNCHGMNRTSKSVTKHFISTLKYACTSSNADFWCLILAWASFYTKLTRFEELMIGLSCICYTDKSISTRESPNVPKNWPKILFHQLTTLPQGRLADKSWCTIEACWPVANSAFAELPVSKAVFLVLWPPGADAVHVATKTCYLWDSSDLRPFFLDCHMCDLPNLQDFVRIANGKRK
jgi:hypothetical protein